VNKDRLLGAGKRAIGAAKQVVGKLFGDANRQVDGSAEHCRRREGHAATLGLSDHARAASDRGSLDLVLIVVVVVVVVVLMFVGGF
jgi:hypothetical protein